MSENINLTIGITGCNRKYYSLALLQSIKAVKENPANNININVIYVDNGSTEPDLVNNLQNHAEIDKVILRTERDPAQDEWKGKNEILKNLPVDCDVLCFFQDDTQIINSGVFIETVKDFYELGLYHMSIHAVRRVTVKNDVDLNADLLESPITKRKYWKRVNVHLNTTGLYSPKLFREIGNYPVDSEIGLTHDGFTSAEDYMDGKAKKAVGLDKLSPLHPHIPSVASIWNDPRGMHAVVRGDKRLGHYIPPNDTTQGLYYDVNPPAFLIDEKNRLAPLSFVDVSFPLGWEYAKTPDGDQVKYSKDLIKSEGPAHYFDNSQTVVNDIESAEPEYLQDWLEE